MKENRRRIARWVLPVISAAAVAAVVGSSLSAEHYYFYPHQDRRAFVPDPSTVAGAFLLSAGEGLVLWLILRVGSDRMSWRRFLIGLLVFVPWLQALWGQIGTHVPGFLVLNVLWVASIVTFLAIGLIVSVAGNVRARSTADAP